jgi:threonylcarbamoyladenosine tRNA methylthiotransferase MtaB
MKIVFETLGCKLNQAETENLTWELIASGHEIVPEIKQADIYILNTCTVTATADNKARQRIRQVNKNNPAAFLVVTGCYAQRDAETLVKIPGVGMVVSNENKPNLVHVLEDRLHLQSVTVNSPQPIPSTMRTRAFVKVQDGCNGVCTYCIVPRVRQGETGVPIDRVIAHIKQRETLGYKEIVLTGTKVGCYNDGNNNLKTLLSTILEQTTVPRIRLSSLQPQEISSELLSLWKDSRLLPHFHLALQSGCDETLRRMRRRYSVDRYKKAVYQVRETAADAAITTDIIVGFPGESEEQFEESYQTCADLQFARIHVFPYSVRPGTEAAAMTDFIDDKTKQERCRKMLALAAQSMESFRAAFHGQTRPTLLESQDSHGNWIGWTDNYILVKTKGINLENQIRPVLVI